jgi:alpha-tubulin suppressor-like RCC1 family protein
MAMRRLRRSWRLSIKLGLALALVGLALPALAAPAGAAGHAAVTRVVVHVAPATVHVGSPLVVSGSVSPRVSGVPVVVQRLVGKSWHTVGKGKATSSGGFSFSVKAPGAAAKWVLRVTRAASASSKAGVSAALHVRVVKAVFVVKAAVAATPVVAGEPLVVTGSVRPKASGTVALQRLVGKVWISLASTKLTGSSTFRFATVRPAGAYRLRVLKAFTVKVAGGVSPGVSGTVVAPPGAPTVTTAGLPSGTVGVAYSSTLTATGGISPYAWSSTGLPAGVVSSATGVVSGTPTKVGMSSVTVVVTDSAGRTGSAVLALTVAAAPRPAGRVWAWGANPLGQLGNGTTTDSNALVPVTGMTSVIAVAGGGDNGYALRSDGTVWAWGFGGQGQLGNNTTVSSNLPVQVSGLAGVTAISAGGYSAYALRDDGTVWAWGFGGLQELGNGSSSNSVVPVQVSGLTSVTAIAGGYNAGYAVRSDGTVWAWGSNIDEQLGNGTTTNSGVPVQVSGLTSATAVATGGNHSAYVLTSDGTVWAWGDNVAGQLGNNSTNDSNVPVQVSGLVGVTAIAAGGSDAYALRTDGSVWAWGTNGVGELGNGTTVGPATVAVRVSGLTSVTAITAGYYGCLALRSDGYVWAWGGNSLGQLGNGTNTDSSVPVQASGLTAVFGIGASAVGTSGYAIEAG